MIFTKNALEVGRKTLWLYKDDAAKEQAKAYIQKALDAGYVMVAYVIEAEARATHTLFGREFMFPAIDLYLEYRNLLNHNDELSYGHQYIDGKTIKTTKPPNKWAVGEYDPDDPDEEDDAHHKPSYSLAAATYKLLAVKIDTEEKTAVRDIIIECDPAKLLESKERILLYNESDVEHLPKLLTAVALQNTMQSFTLMHWYQSALKRGEYGIRTARMVRLGYPINHDKVNLFTANVRGILEAAIDDCLDHSGEVESFRFEKRTGGYVQSQKAIRDWVRAQGKPHWRKTKAGEISLSKDAFKDWYNSESPGFAGAFCRYSKTKQSLNGFLPAKTSKKKQFKEFIGTDGRVRPYFGIYGSQSSRSQPGATSYLWLKAKWMQNFLEAPPGYALASADFASQEFLVAAIISQDKAMMEAYASGDPYLDFGKRAFLIPPDGTKESHRMMREVCKTCVLGMSYLMSAKGLAPRLTQAMGREVTTEQAEELIKAFDTAFPNYAQWRMDIRNTYATDKCLVLSDGWTMWADNDNFRSVANFPVQGEGAVILREAVARLQDSKINVIATVHDSVVIQFKSENTDKVLPLFRDCMILAFESVMKKFGNTFPIRVDGEAWSRDYVERDGSTVHGFSLSNEFIHEKAHADYERYKKFFDGSFIAPKRSCAPEPVKVEKKEAKTPRVSKPRTSKKSKLSQGATNGTSTNRFSESDASTVRNL
jgi:hypothetical protein